MTKVIFYQSYISVSYVSLKTCIHCFYQLMKGDHKVIKAEYFYATVVDKPGEAYRVLSQLVKIGVNLLAFNAAPAGPMQTLLSIFPDSSSQMTRKAKKVGLELSGPYPAFLVQGDDELGAWADIHSVLYKAKINVSASNGVADGKGSYGFVIYVRPDDFERAAKILGV